MEQQVLSAQGAGKLTVSDIAARESVSPKTVLNWVERGDLKPAYRLGRVIRFDEGYEQQLRDKSGA
ncbi:MAG: hypothetical protein CMN05_08000 [Roseibacillus sp.]|jgi:transposase|nr:hypothetical protein [Roseibacillus sp.]MCP4843459.1 helix-turn-helix domain-containing protein [Halieaceae bacterium]|tara:strand:+ start:64 stop:261 length:198 start_codon:yes stop_codon:yes gene_type:complete